MADVKLTAEPELSVVALDDWLAAVDKSDTTDDAAGSDAKLSVLRLLGRLNQVCQGRLTLVSGDPHYSPQTAVPSATDTTAETCDFAVAHGWVTGTMVIVDATVGGLTFGTLYYIRATDSDTVAFYTTFADADADTNRVNLTASITQRIYPIGITWDNLYWEPYGGNLVSLYDGTRWQLYAASTVTLALSALTADNNYDVFLYDNAGTLTLELSAAWTSDTVRADALTTQDGITVKSGATTRRWVGTVRTIGTTTVEDSERSRFVWNEYNQISRHVYKTDYTTSWTWATAAWQETRGQTTNRIKVVCGRNGSSLINLHAHGKSSVASTGIPRGTAIGENATTAYLHSTASRHFIQGTSGDIFLSYASLNKAVPLGYTFYSWLEYGSATTVTWYGAAAAPTSGTHGIFGEYVC